MSDKEALVIAMVELSKLEYQLEMGYLNAGLRKIYSNRAEWLSRVIALANKQMEVQYAEP